MNLKSTNKIDTNRYELEIEVNAQEFEDALNKAYLKQKAKISIPGFRKGKVPRAFIEKYYGENVFYEDAVNSIYPEILNKAIEEAALDVINDKMDFDMVNIGKDGFTFKVALTTKPVVTIEGYKGLEIEPKSCEVTDEDVNEEIEKIRNRNARMISVEGRAAQNDDTAVIDFKGFIDGEAFEGGEAENYNLKLGSGQFIAGFEEQIVGHNVGDEFDVTVKFPEDYHATKLAGKEAVFKVKLNEIKAPELPVFDDEFVKDVSEFDTIEEYKNDLKEKLKEKKEQESKFDEDNQLIDKVTAKLQAEIPEAMFQNKIEENIKEFAYRLQSQGLDVNTYIKYTGMTPESFREGFRPQAERQVKLRLALDKIAELENIMPSKEELDAKFKELADMYKMDIEKIKSIISEKDLSMDLSAEKAVDFIRKHSVSK